MPHDNATLRKIALGAADDWWIDALSAVDGAEAQKVRNLGDGTTTSDLSAPTAVRAVATIDAARLPGAIVGERRATVLDAARKERAANHAAAPAAFTGTLDEVIAKVSARKTISASDAIRGLASRSPEEQRSLLTDVLAKVSGGRWSELVIAAARGTITVRVGDVLSAGAQIPVAPQHSNGLGGIPPAWLHAAWEELNTGAGTTDAIVECAAGFAASGWEVPAGIADYDVAEAARSWPASHRHHAAKLAVSSQLGWDVVGPLIEAMPKPAMAALLSEQHCDPDVAGKLIERVDIDAVRTMTAYVAVDTISRYWNNLDDERLAALFDAALASSWNAGRLVAMLIADPSGPDVDTTVAAIRSIDDDHRHELLEFLRGVIGGPAARWGLRSIAWNGERVTRIEGPVAAALIAEASRPGKHWIHLRDHVANHPASADALGVLCAEALDSARATPGGVAGPAFYAMLSDWDDTLDALAQSCVMLEAH